jgi:putative acetyltransferase
VQVVEQSRQESLMNIRFEKPGDCDAIHAVHAGSFPTEGEARLVDALRAAGSLCASLVAVDEGKVVGHVAFSPITVAGVREGAGLAPVAVLPEYRRRGIAEELIRKGLEACEQLDFGFVVVLGDPTYYRRCGFLPAAGWGLSDEYGGGEAFQVLELRPASIPTGGGLVRYAPEFAVVDDAS